MDVVSIYIYICNTTYNYIYIYIFIRYVHITEPAVSHASLELGCYQPSQETLSNPSALPSSFVAKDFVDVAVEEARTPAGVWWKNMGKTQRFHREKAM